MEQTIINWVMAAISGLLGFLMSSVWGAVKDLQAADKELAREVAEIKVLVAGDYIKKEEFTSTMNIMFTKLDRIEDKLDKKVDKQI